MNSLQLNANIPYATDDELEFITSVCQHLTPQQTMVILGAGPGVMLLAAREGGHEFPIWLVDHLTCHFAQTHLSMAGADVHVTYVISDSSALGRQWRGATVDFLIIDSDHSYEGVKADLLAWLPHIAPKGKVFIHDYDAEGTRFADHERYPGTMQAVQEFIPVNNFTAYLRVGTAIVFERWS